MRFMVRLLALVMAVLMAVVVSACGRALQEPTVAGPGITAVYFTGDAGMLGPDSEEWQKAPQFAVSLLPQDLTDPKLMDVAISQIRVRALCDGQRIAFRLEWDDPTQDMISEGGRFSDAVAIQLPPAPGGQVPDPTMGLAGQPVLIHLWKACYQRRLELGPWDIRQTFPNATVDHYPFEAAPNEERGQLTAQYTIALAAGNPLAGQRISSVDDLTAEGFGTLRPLAAQASTGKGQWVSGTWSVVITRPLSFPQWVSGPGFKPGDQTFAAFAVWDGGLDNAGSRKVRSVWTPLTVSAGGANG
ncbi:MAG: hypothetical protein Kow0099_33090 [Candidatus Abyssubacteria bacterium]